MLKACNNMAAKEKEKLDKAFKMINQDVMRTCGSIDDRDNIESVGAPTHEHWVRAGPQ